MQYSPTEIFGPHPGYMAAVAVYAFGAAVLTGLQFRQSLLVNGVSLGVLLISAWHQPLPLMAVPRRASATSVSPC